MYDVRNILVIVVVVMTMVMVFMSMGDDADCAGVTSSSDDDKFGVILCVCFFHEKRVAAAAVAVAAANTDISSVTTKQAVKRVKFTKHDNPFNCVHSSAKACKGRAHRCARRRLNKPLQVSTEF